MRSSLTLKTISLFGLTLGLNLSLEANAITPKRTDNNAPQAASLNVGGGQFGEPEGGGGGGYSGGGSGSGGGGSSCYQIQNIGTGYITAINDHGDMVGNGFPGPFALVNGQNVDLGITNANQTAFLSDINNVGVIIGNVYANQINRGFIRSNGVVSYVSIDGGEVYLNAVNDRGDVVGQITKTGIDANYNMVTCNRGLVIRSDEYAQGQSIALPQVSCTVEQQFGGFFDINERGLTLGAGLSIGFVLEKHYPQPENLESSLSAVKVQAINNADAIVGSVGTDPMMPYDSGVPAVWRKNQPNTSYTLELLTGLSSGTFGRAQDINDAGKIVGTYGNNSFGGGGFTDSAFIYQNGVIENLNGKLCSTLPAGQYITDASLINNTGKIVASLWDSSVPQHRRVLLTPDVQ